LSSQEQRGSPEPVSPAADSRRGPSAALVLSGWWLFLGACNIGWLAKDTRPPAWDPAIHLLSSVRYRHFIGDFLFGTVPLADSIRRLFSLDAFYPPFAPFVTAFATLGLKPNADASTWVLNQFFLALLLFATYRLGRRAAGSVAGIAAAVAVTTFGAVWSASHAFMLDLPVMAVTALALERLFATDRFSRPGRSLLFGLIGGIGMLTKWTFLFFLIVPLAVEMGRAATLPDRLRRLRNACAALLVWGLVSLPWYLVHAPSLAQDLLGYGPSSPTDWRSFPRVLSLPSLSFYPRAIASLTLLPWAAMLLVGGALGWRRNPEARRLFLLSIAGLLFLTLFRTKDERYAMPVLPAAAVLATAWVAEPRKKPLRTCLLVVGAATVASLALAFIGDPPVRQLWPIEEALAAIPSRPGFSPPCVRVIPDLSCFHRFAFEYAAEAGDRNVEIEGAGRIPWFTDGVIVKTGDQGARPGAALIMSRIAKNEGSFHEIFRKTWDHPLPDGSRVELYRLDVRPLEGVSPQELVEQLRSAVQNEISRISHSPFTGRIEIEATSDEETLRGRFRRIAFSAENLKIAGRSPEDPAILAREIGFELLGVAVNPYRLRDGALELLSLEELAPHLVIREDDASLWLRAAVRDGGARIAFRDGSIHASVRPEKWPALELVVAPRIVAGSAGNNVGLDFGALRVAGVRLPTFLVEALASQYNPIVKQMPCRVRIATLACRDGMLTISGRIR
jgi:hypothetical protein